MGGVGSGSASRSTIAGDELAVLLDAGLSATAIAERLGCTPRTVRNTAHLHHLQLPSERARSRRVVAAPVGRTPPHQQLYEPGWLHERCAAGAPLKSIAAEVGCSVSTVRNVANRLGVERRRAVQRPELRDRAWLADAYTHRRLSTAAIAREIGASDSAVSAALARAKIPTRSAGRDPRLSDDDWLRHAYVDERLSAPAIADRLHVHPQTVYLALERAGVPRRAGGGFPGSWRVDVDWLRAQFIDAGRTATSIADEVGRSPTTVRSALARHGIHRPPPRSPPPARLMAAWKRHQSVWAIARQYGATPQRAELWLAEIGIFLRPRPLVARRTLRPFVRRGDTLTALARRYNIAPIRMRVELLQHELAPTNQP